jgi:hypothetical protein
MTASSAETPLAVEVSGAVGTWDALVGEVVTFTLPRAFAPGTPLMLQARWRDADEQERTLSTGAKAINSRKLGETFEVRAKLHGLTREQRMYAEAYFASRSR